MSDFIAELKRRNVARVALAYIIDTVCGDLAVDDGFECD